MLDEETRTFYSKGKDIYFTPYECKLLSLLINRKPKPTNTEIISQCIWETTQINPVRIYSIIYRLNKKLKGLVQIKSRLTYGFKVEYIGG